MIGLSVKLSFSESDKQIQYEQRKQTLIGFQSKKQFIFFNICKELIVNALKILDGKKGKNV